MYLRISVEVSRGRAERDHEPGRVPRRARGEPVALEEDDVLPAHVGQVVGDRAADDAAADDDDAGAVGDGGARHESQGNTRRPARPGGTTAEPPRGGASPGSGKDVNNPYLRIRLAQCPSPRRSTCPAGSRWSPGRAVPMGSASPPPGCSPSSAPPCWSAPPPPGSRRGSASCARPATTRPGSPGISPMRTPRPAWCRRRCGSGGGSTSWSTTPAWSPPPTRCSSPARWAR